MDSNELTGQQWDCVVVGTGMGGSVFGWALAKAGWRVLFLEQGRHYLQNPDRLSANYAEMFFKPVDFPQAKHAEILSRAGRYDEALTIDTARGGYAHVPFIGGGTGGSTALYGMALERFFPVDFTPRRKHPTAPTPLPSEWPFSYSELEPFYGAAEELFTVRGGVDPLKSTSTSRSPAPAPPLTPSSEEFFSHFQSKGLRPYQIPMACRFVDGCEICQGYLCNRSCKQDAASVALVPALNGHGAALLDRCTVQRLEATANRVERVVCERDGRSFSVTAPVVALAAGALNTPRILLTSSNAQWPNGLANRSGQVGRNLMRHYTDLYAVTPARAGDNHAKQVAFNDFYAGDAGQLGTVQSFGRLPPAAMLTEALKADILKTAFAPAAHLYGLIRPFLRGTLNKLVDASIVFATICEDLPDPANRVTSLDGRLHIHSALNSSERERVAAMRALMKTALSPYRYRLIKQAENPGLLAHACGTCRGGTSAADTVVDRDNRCHDVENLYIVDASFFPTSGGTNPALTVAANALRVADHLVRRGS